MKKTHTAGNVIVEDIKVGDIHYEYSFNLCRKVQVLELPVKEGEGDEEAWSWKSKNLSTGEIVEYDVVSKYSHYSAKLYDYQAYEIEYYV